MDYVYIDESGSFGTKGNFIVFASITTSDPRRIEKAIKQLWRAKPQFHSYGELHAKTVDDSTRKRVLSQLAELPITINHKAFDKSKSKLLPAEAYYSALANFIHAHKQPSSTIIVDKKDTDNKRSITCNKLGLETSFRNIHFEESHRVKPLQAVDFVAWSLGRQYEYDDQSFYDLIRHKESPSL